jgi:hypothetical protein
MKTAEEILNEVLPFRPNFVDIETKYYLQFAKQIAELAFDAGQRRGIFCIKGGEIKPSQEQFIKELFGEK